jgi:hypothetical protein
MEPEWELGKDCKFQHSVCVLALCSLTEALRLFLKAFKISQKAVSTPLHLAWDARGFVEDRITEAFPVLFLSSQQPLGKQL